MAQVTGAKTKAELGRALGMNLKAIWAAMDRKRVPYPHIVDKIPPREWEYVFTGRRASVALSHPEMMQALVDAGYRVERAPRAEGPPSGSEE